MVNTSVISNFGDLSQLVTEQEITGIYIILGNGRGPQYKDMFQVSNSLNPVITKINDYHCGKWMAVYCGIKYDLQNNDIATCMSMIQNKFNPYILSVQPRWHRDPFVDYIFKYDLLKDQYGGVVPKLEFLGEKTHRYNFLAVLSTYIGPEFLGLVNAVINIDSQGSIGLEELDCARKANIEIIEVSPADPLRDASDRSKYHGKLGYEEDENEDDSCSESSELESDSDDEDNAYFDHDNLVKRKRPISEDSDSDEENGDFVFIDYDNCLDNRRKKRRIL